MNESSYLALSEPIVDSSDKKAVLDAMDSGWISSAGPEIAEFEQALSSYLGSSHVVCVQSGTAALHTILLCNHIGVGQDVIVPNITFIATVNSVSYVGAKPILVDINKDTWLMDLQEIKKKITKRTKAIILVHLYGFSYQYKDILFLKKKI